MTTTGRVRCPVCNQILFHWMVGIFGLLNVVIAFLYGSLWTWFLGAVLIFAVDRLRPPTDRERAILEALGMPGSQGSKPPNSQ